MAKRRAEIEEEQELEEERIKNARLSVSNEGESEVKGRVESIEGGNDGNGDVEMKDESRGEAAEKERKRSESRDPENGVHEERSAREERQADKVDNMEEEDGEID